MFKKKNDRGFTLIELMIVIAVIGILAVVLVPKMAGVKDSAKYAGVTTNVKSVEAYVVANIDRWIKSGRTTADVETLITTQFTSDDNALINPFGGTSTIIVGDSTTSGAEGAVLVKINSSSGKTTVEIEGYGAGTSPEVVHKATVTADGTLKTSSGGS